jgi:hypothetical protein
MYQTIALFIIISAIVIVAVELLEFFPVITRYRYIQKIIDRLMTILLFICKIAIIILMVKLFSCL